MSGTPSGRRTSVMHSTNATTKRTLASRKSSTAANPRSTLTMTTPRTVCPARGPTSRSREPRSGFAFDLHSIFPGPSRSKHGTHPALLEADLGHEYLARFDREEGYCSSAGHKRRPGCSAPRSAVTHSPALRVAGAPRFWSWWKEAWRRPGQGTGSAASRVCAVMIVSGLRTRGIT